MGCKNGRERKPEADREAIVLAGGSLYGGPGGKSSDGPDPDEPSGPALLDEYELGKLLGQGGFGVVYECTNITTKEVRAVKMIDRVESPLADIQTEIDALTQWRHPSVVKLYDVYYESVFVCLVMGLYPGDHLITGVQLYWNDKGKIPLPVCQNLMKMMFQSVAWLHSNHVAHRDVKGDNYLLDKVEIDDPECRLYLADFGTVVPCPPGTRFVQRVGTQSYWSPEVYDKDYSLTMDIWALGVVMYALVSGSFPFRGERQVRKKEMVAPERLDADGADLLLKIFERAEEARITAEGALSHPWLSQIKTASDAAVEEMDPGFEAELMEAPASFFVQDRRFDLVDRLERAHTNKSGKPGTVRPDPHACLSGPFEVPNMRTGIAMSLEWWTPDAVRRAKFYDSSKAGQKLDAQAIEETRCQASRDPVLQLLQKHDLNTNSFGLGTAKRFGDFLRELNTGESRLMNDASQHKKLVRVVHVVLLRVVHGEGVNKKYLMKTTEIFPDGRERANIHQLAGNKRLPHENAIMCVQRLVKDRMQTLSGHLKFNFEQKECFEDEEDSPSYPGIPTVYHKEIYEAVVTTTDPGKLASMGLAGPGPRMFKEKDKNNYMRVFEWLNEKQCGDRKIKLKAPADGTKVSILVDPPTGYDADDLQDLLEDCHVDVSLFGKDGTKTLAEFSDELTRGESVFEQTSEGKLIRVVDIVILQAVSAEGNTLVELKTAPSGGGMTGLMTGMGARLPAVKRRADENPFWAAQRLISQVLKMDQNLIHMDVDNVLVLEEKAESSAYAGLPTLYRRRIIPAKAKKL